MAQSTGLGGVSNLNQVMQGAAQASNITPGLGLTQATAAIGGTMNAPTTVNLARTIGINIRQADGSMLPFPQLVDKIWAFISQTGGGRGMDKRSLQYSMQPGYGIYNMLNGLFNGDPVMIKMMSDGLLAKATFGGAPLGNISKQQMVDAGIQSATIRNIGSQTAAQTGLLVSTAAATAGGYAGAADIGTGMNNLAASMSDLTAALGGGKGLFSGTTGLGNGALGKGALGIIASGAELGLGAKLLPMLLGSTGKAGAGFVGPLLESGAASTGSGILGILAKLLPFAFLAEGGPADSNTPYVVGEKGPELFIPKTNGTVIPNSMFRDTGGPVSSYGSSGGKKALTDDQLRSVLSAAGFKGDHLTEAFKVAKMESGGRPGALNPNAKTGDYSEGLFQINMIGDLGKRRNAQYLKDYASIGYKGPQSLYDPVINAKIAYDISHGGTMWSQAWVNTSKKLGIADSGTSNSSSASSASPVMSDPTAASRFAAATAAAFGSSTAGPSNTNYNYNYGGITIQISGAQSPTKTGAAVADAVKKLGKK
jgi:hypothetical protein